MVHPTVLKLAAARAVSIIPAEDEIEASTPGLPGVSRLTIRAVPLAVVAVDGRRLRRAVPFSPLKPEWHITNVKNAEDQLRPEPRVEGGIEVVRLVDANVFYWQMVCACGRVRYAKANSRHQVKACRVCTSRGRRARRNKAQKRARSRA